MAYIDPQTGQVIGAGLMSNYAPYGSPYAQPIPTQPELIAQALPTPFSESVEQGLMGGSVETAQTEAGPAQERALSELGARGRGMALSAGKQAALAGLSGADIGQALQAGVQGAVTPASVLGLGFEPMYAASGVAPETMVGKAIGTGTQMATGLMGGPFGAVLGAVGATPFAAAVEDALGLRTAEEEKDVIESAKGFFGGRKDVADRLAGTKDVAETYAGAKSFAEAANKAIDKLGTSAAGTGLTSAERRAYSKQSLKDIGAYQDLAELAASLRGVGSISDTRRDYSFPTAPVAGKTYGTGYGPVSYGTSLTYGGATPMSPRNSLDARAMAAYDAAMAHERGQRARSSWGGKGAPGTDASGKSRGMGKESESLGSRDGFGGTGIGGR